VKSYDTLKNHIIWRFLCIFHKRTAQASLQYNNTTELHDLWKLQNWKTRIILN